METINLIEHCEFAYKAMEKLRTIDEQKFELN